MKRSSAGKDIVALFQGFGLVLEQFVRRKSPETSEKLKRAQYHASELLKALVELNCQPPKSRGVDPDVTREYQRHKAPVKDIIGFSSIQPSDNETTDSNADSTPKISMQEREVPSTQTARLLGFGSLAARLAFGKVADSASNLFTGTNTGRISDRNAERLAETLCRMRGASLKLGQMLSLQDDDMLPPAVAKALERVKQSADYMPKKQLLFQLNEQLGGDWRSQFSSFEEIPIAAASIGQVHRGVLVDGTVVAMKVQYPGVADSIESDLNNLKALISMTNLFPEGLFIEQIIKVASTELAAECDYEKEASFQIKYRELLLQDSILRQHTSVPQVVQSLSTKRVLTSHFVPGIPIDKAANLSQPVRDAIARTILITTFRELFEWRFVQSDPNFANFLYDNPSQTIHFIDFGATREYSKEFVSGYMRLVWAAANKDEAAILAVSQDLGFLTGDETQEMLNAHVQAGLVVGEPFLTDEPYDFATSKLTTRIGRYGDTFAKHRLTPPPVEAYSLHRKLAGAFLLCIKLKANIPCRDILEKTFQSYDFN